MQAPSTHPQQRSIPDTEIVDWGVNATQHTTNVRIKLDKLYHPTGSIATRSLFHKRASTTQPYTTGTGYQYFSPYSRE